jgi:hypothetical protein
MGQNADTDLFHGQYPFPPEPLARPVFSYYDRFPTGVQPPLPVLFLIPYLERPTYRQPFPQIPTKSPARKHEVVGHTADLLGVCMISS